MAEQFRVTGVVARRAEQRERLTAEWHVPTFASLSGLLTHERPDFVAALVGPDAMADTVRAIVEAKVPVLAETPPATGLEELRSLWDDVGDSGLVQVNEQYRRMPTHASRLAVVGSGTIGQPTSVQISSTHLYHAVSLIRGYLATGFDQAMVRAQTFTAPLANPLGFGGWTGRSDPQLLRTTLATIDFGGRMGFYDFTENQWWNPLRTKRILVRGSNGELVDDNVVRLVDPVTPVESQLVRRQTGVDLDLENLDLRHISFDGQVVYRNPFAGTSRSDDDLAVAHVLHAMGMWARQEGSPPYPLGEACQDQLLSLAISESARTGAAVRTTTERWASG
jgi:hypothetical protein